jgi:prepilin-type processing-associated H-X9-DG protein
LKQIGLALSNYREDHGRFPPAVVFSSEGRPLYSWRVLILPYMEQKDLYDKFDLNEAWDGLHNRELLAQRPSLYDPAGIVIDPTLTFDQVFIGVGTAFDGRQGTTPNDFPDGLDKTLLVVEAAEPVPWTKPIDLPYMEVAQLPPLGGVFKASTRPFDTRGADGFNVVFADGSVRFILKRRIKESTLRALITRNGREPISSEGF